VRAETADEGVTYLKEKVDALIVIPNDRLAQVVDKRRRSKRRFASLTMCSAKACRVSPT